MSISITKESPPPKEQTNVLGWLYRNLFSTWYNTLLTICAVGLVYVVLVPVGQWAFTDARWSAVTDNLRLFMIGRYPIEQAWRPSICLFLLAATVGLNWGSWVRSKELVGWILLVSPLALAVLPVSLSSRLMLVGISAVGGAACLVARRGHRLLKKVSLYAGAAVLPISIAIILGIPGSELIPFVKLTQWGGLMLTVMLAIVGIIFCFPIGVALALGRRSKLPIISVFCVGFIEIVRGFPLVTGLFMMNLMLPLFLPAGIRPDNVLRALVGITLFSAVFMAENIRGGLQAIPTGQYEAAQALSLSGFQTTVFIILPQALKAVIPVLVSQFITLLKDTTLVMVIGLFDILGIGKAILNNPNYIGTQREIYLFVAGVFWVLSYALSYASGRLEKALGVGER